MILTWNLDQQLQKNTATSKNFDDSVMLASCEIIVIFPIYGQFGAIRKPDSERMFCKIYISILQKLKTELKKVSNTALLLLLWVKVLFLIKKYHFLQKNADISKTKKVSVLKGIFSETAYVCVLAYQISSF